MLPERIAMLRVCSDCPARGVVQWCSSATFQLVSGKPLDDAGRKILCQPCAELRAAAQLKAGRGGAVVG